MFPPEVEAALSALTSKLNDLSPDAKEVIEKIKRGELSEVEAMQALMAVLGKDPSIGEGLNQYAMTAFEPTHTDIESMVSNVDLAIMQPPTGKGNARLNPNYESALIERAQFDGDIPELRTGPMPNEATPAVPVETTARNPVAIGEMLKQASAEVKEAMDANRTKALGDAMHLANGLLAPRPDTTRIGSADEVITFNDNGTVDSTVRAPGTLSAVEEAQVEEDQNFLAAVDSVIMKSEPEGYKTGRIAVPMAVEVPTGSALAALTPEQRRDSAFHFLSTTQGRRTALKGIAEIIEAGLKSDGIELTEVSTPVRPDVVDSVPCYAEWTVNVNGAQDTQSSFSFMDVAAKALTRKLSNAWDDLDKLDIPKNPRLEVVPINTVDVRKVGWAARIISGAV
jgi:hypothetical protein